MISMYYPIPAGCCVLFNQRLGCLGEDPPEDISLFVEAVSTMFRTTEKLAMAPTSLVKHLHLNVWREHRWAWDVILHTGGQHNL